MKLFVISAVIALCAALAGWIWYVARTNGQSKVYTTIKGVITLVLCVAALGCLLAGCAQQRAANAADDPNPSDSASASPSASAPAASPSPTPAVDEKPEMEEIIVDLNEDELDSWFYEKFGPDYKVRDAQTSFSRACLFANASKRYELVTQALRRYVDPAKDGFDDAVVGPLDNVLAEYYGKAWSTMSAEMKAEVVDEARILVYKEILTNPVYRDMWVQIIIRLGEDHPEILEQNPWVVQLKAEADEFYSTARVVNEFETVVGNAGYFEKVTSDEDPLILKRSFVLGGARICALLDSMHSPSAAPVQELTSLANWHLVPCADANATRTVPSSAQEDLPAIILEWNYKDDGGTAIRLGVNIFDGRGEIFNPKTVTPTKTKDVEPSPSPTPSPSPSPSPSPTPTPTSQVATAKVTVHFINRETGTAIAPDQVKTGLVAGQGYTFDSPTITGFTPDRARVVGNMPSPVKDVEEVVYYTRNVHTLRIEYRFAETGVLAAPTYVAQLKYGEAYAVTSPTITGWTPDQAVVSGTMPDWDVNVTVFYSRVTDGNGVKDKDATNGNNPGHPSGDLAPGDGDGNFQATNPPEVNTPAESIWGADTAAGSDYRQTVSSETISATAEGDGESSGLGGQDHTVVGPGETVNGTPPAKETFVDQASDAVSVVTNPTGGTSGTNVNNQVNGGAVAAPGD